MARSKAKRKLFDELSEGLEAIRDKPHTLRRRELTAPDVKAIREQFGMSQSQMATLLNVSPRTLQNWEQHRRNPTGPAAALLKIVSTAPEVALKSLHG